MLEHLEPSAHVFFGLPLFLRNARRNGDFRDTRKIGAALQVLYFHHFHYHLLRARMLHDLVPVRRKGFGELLQVHHRQVPLSAHESRELRYVYAGTSLDLGQAINSLSQHDAPERGRQKPRRVYHGNIMATLLTSVNTPWQRKTAPGKKGGADFKGPL